MEIHGERAVGARHGDQVGDQLGGDGCARLVLAVLPRVAEIGHHRGDAPRRGPLGRVQHHQQLHQVLGRGAGGLDDEHVAAADVLVELDCDLPVLEARHLGVAERHLELLADRLRQPPAGVAREDPTRVHPLNPLLARIIHEPSTRSLPPGPENGWGGRIRTSGCEIQSLVPYRLATPHQQNGISVTVRNAFGRSGVMAMWPLRESLEKSRGSLAGGQRAVNRGGLTAAVSEPLPRSIAQVTAGWWRGRSQGVSGAAPYGRAGRLDPSSDGGAPRSSPCSGGWGRGEAGLSTRLAQPGSGATSAARLSRKRRSSSMAASGR